MIKKNIKILITLIISIIVIITPRDTIAVRQSDTDVGSGSTDITDEDNNSSDESNNSSDATENENESSTSEKDEIRAFSIEEIIFNRIPVLNVNVFDTSDADPNGIAGKIRNSIATWYVSFRNISIVALAFVLLYVGIRMAISTSASEKANYKKMLINWVTAMLIVFFIHYIMIIVFYINDNLVELLSKSNQSPDELSIYERIREQSKDLRFSVGIPAAIIYIALFIYSLMFLWIYIKRFFTVLILIILAPFVGIKYAVDSAGKGQRSKILLTWTYEFSMNVLIQPVHALLYVTLMQIAFNLISTTSETNFIGFILALVFINFMLKADKIFMKIFHFDRSNLIKDVAEPRKNLQEEFAGALFVGRVAKDTYGDAKRLVKGAVSGVGRGARFVYREFVPMDTRRNITEKKEEVTDKKNVILNRVDDKLNTAYKTIRGKDNNYLILKMTSRKKDKTGKLAKQTLKTYKKNMKAKFTAPFKFIKQAGGSVFMIGMSLPVAVASPKTGLTMATKGVKNVFGMANQKDSKGNQYTGKEGLMQAVTLGAYGTHKEQVKGNKKVGATVLYINQVTIKENEIQKIFSERFEKTSDEAMRRYQKEVKFYIKYANEDNLNMILRQELAGKGVINIDDNNIDSVINDMTDKVFEDLGIEKQYSQNMANQIRKKMKENAKSLYDTKKARIEENEFGSLDLAHAFSKSIKEEGISEELNDENMQKTMDKFLEDEKIDNITSENVDDVVNRFTDTVVSDLKLVDRSKNTDIVNNIKQETSQISKDMSFQYGEASQGKENIKTDISNRVQEIVKKHGKQAGIDFGYGEITKGIEELHEINKKAQKDIKSSVVNENRFIDSLQKNNKFQ